MEKSKLKKKLPIGIDDFKKLRRKTSIMWIKQDLSEIY